MSEVKLPIEDELSEQEVAANIIMEALANEAAQNDDEKKPIVPDEIPIMPLRENVIFPMLIAPLSVSRESSIQLIDEAVSSNNRVIGVVTQRDSLSNDPGFDGIYGYGCAVIIRTLVKMPDAVRLIVQGVQRFKILEPITTEPYLKAKIQVIEEPEIAEPDAEEIEALRRTVASIFEQAIRLSPQLPDELKSLTQAVNESNVMADLVAAHMTISVEDKQKILEETDLEPRLKLLVEILAKEVRVLELTSKVHHEVNTELSKNQREYYLREQLKAIQKELGEGDDRGDDVAELEEQIAAAGLPEVTLKDVNREMDRMARMNPSSPEYAVARNYVETLVALPWNKETTDDIDLKKTRKVLDSDHFGLEKIKERILEFLAVRVIKQGPIKQPILCFVGPPGVGKTSLGRSIATAMGRNYCRLSLGGMRDEAEIRGHRRTYIGAMPGQVIQSIRRAGTNNPVMVLDEIDKLGSDHRGDPSSALLEVLDPEQNITFRDHYLDTPFDLSKVFFIATANRMDTIPAPLRDRMEIIELGGYTEEEKIEIAARHLVPKQIDENGLDLKKVAVSKPALRTLVRHYTREAGVRNLEREVGSVMRKIAMRFALGREEKFSVTPNTIQEDLGSPRYLHDMIAERSLMPGMAIGLAWTPVGGDVLFIESTKMTGKGSVTVTGQLGDVMRESVTAAMSYIRSHAKVLGIDPEVFEKSEIHVHVPAGAVPKDGPSAGITMLSALVSLLTNQKLIPRLAMTGEITLLGQVLPVGGIKEKVLAAQRAGVTALILPEANKKDYLEDVPENVREKLSVHFVKRAPEVIKIAFGK
jgi:ATP-dependent Lon protease